MSDERRPSPAGEPAPGSPEERAADRHALKVFALWFLCCAAVAAICLAIAIWADWK